MIATLTNTFRPRHIERAFLHPCHTSQAQNILPPALGGRGGQCRVTRLYLKKFLCIGQHFALAPLAPQCWGEYSQYFGLFQLTTLQEMPS